MRLSIQEASTAVAELILFGRVPPFELLFACSHLYSDPKLHRNNEFLKSLEPIPVSNDFRGSDACSKDAGSACAENTTNLFSSPKYLASKSTLPMSIHGGVQEHSRAVVIEKDSQRLDFKIAETSIVTATKVAAVSSPGRFVRKLDNLGE